jgi:hypothetical protein
MATKTTVCNHRTRLCLLGLWAKGLGESPPTELHYLLALDEE